jgi:hypothetical protein
MAKLKPFRIRLGEPRTFGRSRTFGEAPTLDPNKDSSQLGGSLSGYVPPGAQYDYKPPSVFAEYKILTVIFGVLIAGLFVYWALIPRHERAEHKLPPAASAAGPSADPVYIEPLTPQRQP